MMRRWTLLTLLAGLLASEGSAYALPPKPITTNKTRFRIPFKYDTAALQRMNARELQLHVSKDRGASWELVQTLAPDGGKFEFQAPNDGEYWFSVKTVDGRNQLHPPAGSHETGLIVVVDRAEPLLDLTLDSTGRGTSIVSWQAADANLDSSTLVIEYTAPGSTAWEKVALVPKGSGDAVISFAQSGTIQVRGSVADTAGNVGQKQIQSKVTAASDSTPKTQKSSRRVPIAESDDLTGRVSLHEASDLGDESLTPTLPDQKQPAGTMTMSREKAARSRSALPDNYRGPVITPFSNSSGGQEFVSANSNLTGAATSEWKTSEWKTSDQQPQQATNAFVSTSSQPRLESTSQERWGAGATMPLNAQGPTRIRVVNQRKFQVGYKVDEVGPSGIGAVEVFITEDGGRRWWKYGNDPDNRSPFDVEVPHDGNFGFAIRVRSGAGLVNEPPASGEAPAIMVSVDQTPPVIEMAPPQQGQGANINRVLLRWRLKDDHPSDKPISLYYSGNPNGPWEPITQWKEDTGSHEWAVPFGAPQQIYLRVVARDAGGNMSKLDTVQPLIVDTSRPKAQIVDIEVFDGTSPQ